MRGVAETTIDRYFVKDGDVLELRPRLRERVEFKYLNLAEDTYPSLAHGIYDMDLIMCRNVLIYFDEATVCRVAQRLLDSLSRTGWLLTGASDPPISQLIECDVVTTPAGLAYRRPGAGGADAVHTRAPAAQASPPGHAFILELPAPLEYAESYGTPSEPTASQLPASAHDVPPAGVRETGGSSSHESNPAGQITAEVRALCNAGETRKAAEIAVRAIDAGTHGAELYYLLGVALAHEERTADAIQAAKRALYMDREFVIAHVLLGQLYARSKDRSAAVRAFRNAAELLERQDADAVVAATDGERVGRIREAVAVQLRLLQVAA
jgi:chemotaxis protein methyltransferase CheR